MEIKKLLFLILLIVGTAAGLLLLFRSGLIHSRAPEVQIEVGFVGSLCPIAESTVKSVVEKALAADASTAPELLRLQFHDCFVRGCDGSILIRQEDGEMFSPENAGVGGFSVIDFIKQELERVCPGVVSCADVIALAARDAIGLVGGPYYPVPTGRRDGLTSRSSDAESLPSPRDSLKTLTRKFKKHGLTERELVLLSAGAHTIGKTACFFVSPRLQGDPTLDFGFSEVLRSVCPVDGDVGVKIALDWGGGERVFDNHIFKNIQSGKGVLASDAILYADKSTRGIIDEYASSNTTEKFARDFALAMIKLGQIGVLTGKNGEIREFCYRTNGF